MAIRFDDVLRTVSLSVRDLAGDDDHRFSGPAPLTLRRRAHVGRVEHEVHQGAREAEVSSYRRERSLRYETRVGDWTVIVNGRIDGIYTDPQGSTVIEEVKTVVASDAELAQIGEDSVPSYALQLRLYRYLLEETAAGLEFGPDAPEIALHLCWIALPSRAQKTVEVSYDPARCASLIQDRVAELVIRHERERKRTTRRQALKVPFPHPEPRPHQTEVAERIAAALEAGRPILVSAPPGIGKTAAALTGALRHAAAIGGRVLVLSAKTTQQAIYARTLELMREAGSGARGVILRAREKGCLNHVVDCRPEACEFARDYVQKRDRSGALERLRELPVIDPERVRAEAEVHRFCPVEASLDLTEDVEVIVGDYNYAFDPAAVLRRMFVDKEPTDVVLLIDEAHNLYERARRTHSPSLSGAELLELGAGLERRQDKLSRAARATLGELLDYLARVEGGQLTPLAAPEPAKPAPPRNHELFGGGATPAPAPAPPPQPRAQPRGGVGGPRPIELDRALLGRLRDQLEQLTVALFASGGAKGSAREEPLVLLSRRLSSFVSVMELAGPEFAELYLPRAGGTLKILCKDPSRLLARRVKACAGAVAVSGTLDPLPFYRDVLGFGPDAELVACASPFPPERRRVLILDRPSTTYRERERDLPIVEDAVRAVIAARAGNYLVCCPSFAYLEGLAARLQAVPGHEVLRQERSMSEDDRRATLERLRRSTQGQAPPGVLFCVQGGIFTEGVDYPGELCVGAIVVGPGLPQVNLERELIRAHCQERYGAGFDYAFLYPGMNKVIQAAGRVIRTPGDLGVVALVGQRFATRRYASLLPRDWYRESPRELISHDPYGDLTRFWAGVEGARAI
ncbi:MAG: ATP-dependent DNA helicase [Planctomycetota bacterium]